MPTHRFISTLGLGAAVVATACSLLDGVDTDSDAPSTNVTEASDAAGSDGSDGDGTTGGASPTSGVTVGESGIAEAGGDSSSASGDTTGSDPSADTGGSTGELSCDEIEVAPVEPADRRIGIGYLFLQGAVNDVGLAARSLCLGDCLNIQDLDVRALCTTMVTGDACHCETIVDYTLRNVCQGSCDAIGTDADMRNFCLGGEACALLQDHDMRSFCMGDCSLIPNDPSFRYLCDGACNLIN